MNGDWRLVARKELADVLGRLGRKPLERTLGVVVLFGILIPLRFTDVAYLPVMFALFMAFLPARLLAVEALAGERERGTLEPLLASPLSDRAIAVGKIVAATVYGAVRSWLFVAVWVPSVLVLRAAGVGGVSLPSPGALAAVLLGAVLVSYAASVFGVWQSAGAMTVRAILESGGALRLVIIVGLFFVLPWLFGVMSPEGAAPVLPLPGGQGAGLPSLSVLATTRPGLVAGVALLVAVGGLSALAALTRSTIRRCARERLTLVEVRS